MQQLSNILYTLSLISLVWLLGVEPSSELQAQTTQNVIWTDLVNTTATGNDLKKTSGSTGWNGGGASQNTIPANTDGWVEFEVGNVYRTRTTIYPMFMCGLSTSNVDANYTTIEFAFYVNGNRVYIRESGTNKNGPHTITANSTFKIERIGTEIKYYVNNTLVYTSLLTAPTGSLLTDASIYKTGDNHRILDAVIHHEGGPAPTCEDGIQNGDEQGVDCGGETCAACATCEDGIQNGDEEGVDCGGGTCPECSSAPPSTPSCEDGIQNGTETGVDCGGEDCEACSESVECPPECPPGCVTYVYPPCAPLPPCCNGVQDGDETGVDCGGGCPNICPGDETWANANSNGGIQYSSGTVSIGATDMEIVEGYKLFVEGGILTEALTTGVKNSADWSDYVFEEGYQRLSLEEVSAFIKANQHLPNVPSASEVVAKGVNVAQMDATLLRQIEELWLHLIDMQKQNEAIRVKNEKLRREVEALVENLSNNHK